MIFVQQVICFIATAAILLKNVLTNNDIDPDYGQRVKLMNMEYGEILSSFENGEWTLKESRKIFRQANKLKMSGQLNTVAPLISTKCTTDRPIIMDKNYVPDTHEEDSDDIQEHGSIENKGSSGENEEKKSLENNENVASAGKTNEDVLEKDDHLFSNEPENNSIGDSGTDSDVVDTDNKSAGLYNADSDSETENSNSVKEVEDEQKSIEENKQEVVDTSSYQDRHPEIDGMKEDEEPISQNGKNKKIYIPPKPRKSPDHYIDDM